MGLSPSLRVGVIMYQTSLSKGQELVAQRMVREFNRLGHSAYLITSTYQDGKQVITEEEVTNRGGYVHLFDDRLGIPVIRVGSETANWPPRRIMFRNFVGVLSRIVSDLKLDVLITHSTLWNGPEEATKFVVWNRKMIYEGANNPQVLLCHMSHFQEASDERYTVEERTFRETWNRVSLGEILRQADYVLVTTPIEEMQMRDHGASDEKCILFPGGIDEEIFDGDHNSVDIRKRLGIPRSIRLISFVGTVEARKNVLGILEVARNFDRPDVHFVVAGRLEGEYAEKVEKAASSMKNVTLAGEMSDYEKAQLIDESFVNLTMSRSEALGIAQLEFMYRGVPVISSGVGGQSWVVRDGVNGVVINGPDDVPGATQAIQHLLTNPKVWKNLSKVAKQTSSQATLSHLVAALAEIFMARLIRGSEPRRLQAGSENLVEAKVQGKKRVTVTTQRLIVSSAKGGKLIVSIPFGQIVKISRMIHKPWITLAIGLVLTAVGFALEMRFPLETASLVTALESVFLLDNSALGSSIFRVILPLVPAIVGITVFSRRTKDGFVVHYGGSQKIFLARDFGMALRTVHALARGAEGTIDEPDSA